MLHPLDARVPQAFVALSRVLKQDFLAEFLDEALLKLPTFKHATMANLLTALGRLGAPEANCDKTGTNFNFVLSRGLDRRAVLLSCLPGASTWC